MAAETDHETSSRLIDFAAPARSPPVALARRLVLGGVGVTRAVLRPNPGTRLGAAQLTVALHQSAPFRMEWRTPGSDRLRSGLIVPGRAHIAAPDRSFWQRWRGLPRILVISIERDFAAAVAEQAFKLDPALDALVTVGVDDPILRYFGALFDRELAGGGAGGRLYAESLASSLVVHLVRAYGARDHRLQPTRGGIAPLQLHRIVEYIDDHLAEDLTLAELADLAGLSRHHFAHAFKESTGRPPHRYLIERRIHRAKELLADPKLSIAEIGFATGFASQSHFTFHFRRLTGATPARFRRAL